MVHLRSRGKAKAGVPKVVLKIKATAPKTSATTTNGEDLSEAALRKLSRPELQKLAKAHKVKANMKSDEIIQQLARVQVPKKARPAEDDPEEGSSRKRPRREVVSEEAATLPPGSKPAPQDAQPSHTKTSAEDKHADPVDRSAAELGPSLPRSTSPGREVPIVLSYDRDLFSGTESEMTEEEQRDFDTPVSSRGETPPPANVNDLKRCVTIMRQISEQDVALLDKVTDIRETAAKLRKKARDVRELVKAESGRRERMEAYFRYWQEIEPTWDRKWLYDDDEVPNQDDSAGAAGPSTMPGDGQGPSRPMVPPDEVKRRKQAILAKQQAEQRELEACH